MISKILSAYGIILVMNLFFLIIPQVNKMQFFESNFENSVVHILFLIGGAFAVTKANLVIAQLTGSQAGGRELAQKFTICVRASHSQNRRRGLSAERSAEWSAALTI